MRAARATAPANSVFTDVSYSDHETISYSLCRSTLDRVGLLCHVAPVSHDTLQQKLQQQLALHTHDVIQ